MLLNCRPLPGEPSFLYLINLKLTGPITDEQNTRGRVIYAPEDTVQTLGILLSKKIPLVSIFAKKKLFTLICNRFVNQNKKGKEAILKMTKI